MKTLEGNGIYGGLFNDTLVGFRCDECGKVVASMMGSTCNQCKVKERRHQEVLEAIKTKETK